MQNKITKKPFVSVIIPVYNTEKYINKCIDSVLNQTLNNIEIILIDDGSTDNSFEIMQQYKIKDDRIKITRQKNLYAGVARNNGLKHAIGEYVYFLDSDDFITKKCLEKTYINAKNNNADIVLFNCSIYNENLGEYKKHCFLNIKNISKPVFNVFDCPDEIFKCTNPGAMTKLYRRDFIKDNNLLFSTYKTSNDIYFTSISLVLAKVISIVNEDLVIYRENSQTSVQKNIDTTDNIINALNDIKKKLHEINLYNVIEKSYIYRSITSIIYTLGIIDCNSKNLFIKKLYDSFFIENNIINLKKEYYIDCNSYFRLKEYLSQYNFYNKYFKYDVIQKNIIKNAVLNPIVSVIIPVYNVEKYLVECIESIRKQTLSNIEIIFINDGSTDLSLEIIQEYVKKDKRISIYSQNNCGLSIARNLGLKVAKGKYIYFIDSDDLLDENALKDLYTKSENENLDLVLFNAETFADDASDTLQKELAERTKDYFIRNYNYNKIYKGIDIFNLMQINKDYISSACLLFARADLYINNNINFIERIIHEDESFTFQTILLANKVGYINKKYYKRRYRSCSIMTSEKSFENVYGYFKNILSMIEFLSKNNEFCCKNTINYILNLQNSALILYKKINLVEKNNYLILDTLEKILFFINIIHNINIIDEKNKKINDLNYKISHLNNSISFRIGRYITYFPRKIRNFILIIKNIIYK